MTTPIVAALIAAAAAGMGALIKGVFDYVTNNRKLITDLKAKSDEHEISAWEQWRQDNTQLRSEVAELRSEISALRADLKEHERGRDSAEAECKRLQSELERLQTETERLHKETVELRKDNKELSISLETTLRAQELSETALRERVRSANGKETHP